MPVTCTGCEKPLKRTEVGLCWDCKFPPPKLEGRCGRCGTGWQFTLGGDAICPKCKVKG